MEEQKKAYIDAAPPSAARIIERSFTRTGGRANAIKAKCLTCANFVREEVRECTAHLCPLHAWRPYQPKSYVITGGDPETTPIDDWEDGPDDDDLDPVDDDDEL